MGTVKEIKFIVNIFVVGLLFVIVYAAHVQSSRNDFTYNQTPEPAATFHVPAHCWTGGEGHPYPHHMIAAVPGDGQMLKRGEHWTNIAMNSLGNMPVGLDVLAFCE